VYSTSFNEICTCLRRATHMEPWLAMYHKQPSYTKCPWLQPHASTSFCRQRSPEKKFTVVFSLIPMAGLRSRRRRGCKARLTHHLSTVIIALPPPHLLGVTVAGLAPFSRVLSSEWSSEWGALQLSRRSRGGVGRPGEFAASSGLRRSDDPPKTIHDAHKHHHNEGLPKPF
jgi:hypothetical protein